MFKTKTISRRRTRIWSWLVGAALSLTLLLLLADSGVSYAVAVISATKTDALQVDADSSGNVSPGDTLRYTITIQNSGDQNAANAVFNDTIDNNTTFVPGSLQTTPLARNDSYSTVGNVQLTVPVGSSVLLNDSDPDGSGGLSVTAAAGASANGGAFAIAADGSFSYNPPAGFSGTDTFTYIANDGESNTNPATVSISVGQVVWFINNAVGAGDGRFASPFNSIAAFNATSLDDPGDYIFIYQGAGAYSGIIALQNNQQLIGHGVGLSISPNLAIAAASRPTIAGITLASGNTGRGLNVSASTGTAVSGASVGALTINNVSVSNSGGVGVSLAGGNSSMAVTFDSVSSSGGANGIVLTNNAGSFASNGGTIDPTTGHGIQVSNTSAGPLNFTLQNSTVTGAPAGFNGVNFEIPTSGSFGNINITSNSITNHGSTGLRANIQGTGSIGLIAVTGNTFSGNPIGVDVATNGTASVDFNISNNPTMSGNLTQVNIAANDTAANNGVGPTMEGHIRNNTITLNPAQAGLGVWVVAEGDGNITANIEGNNITGFGDSGIGVESRGGTGDVNARIASNTASTTAAFPLAGLFLRSGNGTAGETSLLCANVSGNNMSAGAGAVADYYLDRFNPATTVFQIQGLSPSPATPAQAEAFVVSTDAAPPATAFAETGTYTNATCATVSFASLLEDDGTLLAHAAGLEDMIENVALPPTVVVAPAYLPLARHDDGKVGGGLAAPLPAPITPVSLGTLNPGEQIVITFDVTINSNFSGSQVCNQGNITADGGINVLTNDPDTGPANDATCTPVVAATATPTNTATNTPTNTPVAPTDTPTNTPTATDTPTNTPTPTDTPTNTPVPPTDTPTNTPTNTPVPPTDTPTSTPTNTPVPPTDTPTPTPTNTPVACPLTPVLDDFNRPNGAVGNNNWSGATNQSKYRIVNQQVDVEDGGPLYWKPSSFGANQEAYMTLTAIHSNSEHHSLMLKVQTNDVNQGGILISYNDRRERISVEAVKPGQGWKTVQNFSIALNDGDVLGGQALADGTVRVYVNCTLIGTADTTSVVGNTYVNVGGRIGPWFSQAANAVFDNFGGGNIP